MTNILEAIRKQAMAVKNQSSNIEAAKILEDAAKILRETAAGNHIKLDFSKIAKAKQSRLDKFAFAMKAGSIKETEQLLTANGWSRRFHDEKTGASNWGKNSKPGYLLKIKNGSFNVMIGKEITQAKTEISFLPEYLKQA